jgi:hypothetical protein
MPSYIAWTISVSESNSGQPATREFAIRLHANVIRSFIHSFALLLRKILILDWNRFSWYGQWQSQSNWSLQEEHGFICLRMNSEKLFLSI